MKSSNRFTAYSSYPIELKLGWIILDISSLDRFASDCPISTYGALWGARILKSLNRFTAYNFYSIELKFGRMTLGISPLDRCPSRGAVAARLLRHLNRFTGYSIHPIELKLCGMILGISPHNLAQPDFLTSSQKVLWGRAS